MRSSMFQVLSRRHITSAARVRPHIFWWPRGLKCGLVKACLLGLGFQIQPGAWMFVMCVKTNEQARTMKAKIKYGKIQREQKNFGK